MPQLAGVLQRALAAARGGVLWSGPDGAHAPARVCTSSRYARAACAAKRPPGPAGTDAGKVLAQAMLAKSGAAHAGPGLLAARLAALRWIKSPAEVALMRASARASAAGIIAGAAVAQPGMLEAAAAAAHEWEVRARGAARLSFPTVAAAGRNAATIHYGRLDQCIGPADLFLMDAGCEMHGYVSDVTRTWPCNGRFTPVQRAVYEHVAETHAACIKARPQRGCHAPACSGSAPAGATLW